MTKLEKVYFVLFCLLCATIVGYLIYAIWDGLADTPAKKLRRASLEEAKRGNDINERYIEMQETDRTEREQRQKEWEAELEQNPEKYATRTIPLPAPTAEKKATAARKPAAKKNAAPKKAADKKEPVTA